MMFYVVLGPGVVIQVKDKYLRFSLQLKSSTIGYFNLFTLNSCVATWPFRCLSTFDPCWWLV